MLNYSNINDVEFEYLCKDILERKLCISLQRFAAGKDGGIDLTDDVTNYNIVVQMKHYIKSTVSTLISKLREEIPKIKKLSPQQYYLCCAKELTASNKKEIYELFKDYMESEENIFTLIEIDDFLFLPENTDILRKHYKLWLNSTEILSEISNQNIFIDCDSLLYDIEKDKYLFVQTLAYEKCSEILDKYGIVMLLGAPGVGKTMTSKMLALYYAANDFRIRYTTNGDISDIKNSLSVDKGKKEIVLLDDCLGQFYFNMKDTQAGELIALLKYIHNNPNKKLIMNSRVTIFKEAQRRSIELGKMAEEKEFKIYTINMEAITLTEKARIFYNHLYYQNLPDEYFLSIVSDKGYWKIIQHRNYTPRIIEFACLKSRYSTIPSEKYLEYILTVLKNPKDIWENEYDHRLKEVDRILVSTLFSLTDTLISFELLKICYNYRISNNPRVDKTQDQFSGTVSRLQGSFIRLIDVNSELHIGFVNPSINDFMSHRLNASPAELEDLQNSIISVQQVYRLLNNKADDSLKEKFSSEEILAFNFESYSHKIVYLTSGICQYLVNSKKYYQYIKEYFSVPIIRIRTNYKIKSKPDIIYSLLTNPLRDFYEIEHLLSQKNEAMNCLVGLGFDDLTEIIASLYPIVKDRNPSFTKEFFDYCVVQIKLAVDDFASDIDASDYENTFFIEDIIESNTTVEYDGEDNNKDIDMDSIIDEVEEAIKEAVEEQICEYLDRLPSEFENVCSYKCLNPYIDVDNVDDLINAYIDDGDNGYDSSRISKSKKDDDSELEIDAIFRRL